MNTSKSKGKIDRKIENSTSSKELLNEEETIREIARIASGDITEISIKHAKELRIS